jgi:thiamine-phosphate pyrophosphorylase
VFELLAITNRFICKEKPLIQAVKEAVEGGADAVLLREFGLDDRLLYTVAMQFKKMLQRMSVPLLISQRPDIALAVKADGVHLGSHSLPVDVVRSVLGCNGIIGFSAHSLEEVLRAESMGVDYVTVSPIFSTRSKPFARPLGLNFLERAASSVEIPVLALGGVDPSVTEQVMERGAHGVAVMSALWKGDPGQVAGKIRSAIISTMEEKKRL